MKRADLLTCLSCLFVFSHALFRFGFCWWWFFFLLFAYLLRACLLACLFCFVVVCFVCMLAARLFACLLFLFVCLSVCLSICLFVMLVCLFVSFFLYLRGVQTDNSSVSLISFFLFSVFSLIACLTVCSRRISCQMRLWTQVNVDAVTQAVFLLVGSSSFFCHWQVSSRRAETGNIHLKKFKR